MRLPPVCVPALAGALSFSFLLAASLTAQQKDPVTGFGARRLGPLDVGASTANTTVLGVVELGGQFYVSARGASGLAPHKIYVLSSTGALLRSFDQSTLANQTSVWGYRDGDTDGVQLAFGYEGGIEIIDPANGALVTTFNGQPVTNPINAGIGVHRGVAFDRNGNGGAGSFWTGSFGGPLYEISLQGNILRTVPPPATAWSIYGLAWDTQGTATGSDDTLWINSTPNEGDIREFDPRLATYTGNRIRRHLASSIQGGLDGVDTLLGGNGAFGLVGIDQSTSDLLTVYRVDRDSLNFGENEALLLSGVGTGTLSVDTPKFYHALPNQISMGFDISRDASLLGRPGVLIVNVGFNLPNTVIPGYPELVAQLFPAVILSVALGQPNFSFPVPTGIAVGTQVRTQTVYYEPRIRSGQFAMTNQVLWERAEVVVMAEGTDSFDPDPSSGFFSITNYGSDPIVEATLDWSTSSFPLVRANQDFDTDQPGMTDRFDAGNSSTPGCRGTYRNGSDVAAGLIYDAANTVRGVSCAPTSNCGWIGTNPGNDPNDWKTLRFRFTAPNFRNGVRFEFDCDTDGGGTGGDEMSGLVVTIKTAGGRTLGPAELVSVNGQSRSLVKF